MDLFHSLDVVVSAVVQTVGKFSGPERRAQALDSVPNRAHQHVAELLPDLLGRDMVRAQVIRRSRLDRDRFVLRKRLFDILFHDLRKLSDRVVLILYPGIERFSRDLLFGILQELAVQITDIVDVNVRSFLSSTKNSDFAPIYREICQNVYREIEPGRGEYRKTVAGLILTVVKSGD